MKKKKDLIRLSTRIINTPIMISPDKLNIILAAIGPRIGLDITGLEAAQTDWQPSPDENNQEIETEGALAIIPVHGTLVQRASGLDALSGLRSYEGIRDDFQKALNDETITGIILDIDSPGGEVSGIFDLADEIYEARTVKPVFAVANERAYSAAYLLASAAEKVYLPRTAGMGSIGVIAIHVDQSEWDKKEGLAYTAIYAGAHKNDFSIHKPLEDQAREVIQTEIDEVYNLFVDTVARNRQLKPKDIKTQEAGIFQGTSAVKAGLADAVMSWNKAINNINQEILTKGGKKMDITLEILEKEAPDLLTEIREAARAEVTIDRFSDEVMELATTAADDERKRIMGIFMEAYGKEVADKFSRIITPGASMADIMAFAKDAAKADMLTKLQKEAPESLGPNQDPEDNMSELPDGEERWKKEFIKSAELQEEFGNEGRYLAFKRAEKNGQVRILRSKKV